MKLASLAKKTDPVCIQTKGKATAEIPPFADSEKPHRSGVVICWKSRVGRDNQSPKLGICHGYKSSITKVRVSLALAAIALQYRCLHLN